MRKQEVQKINKSEKNKLKLKLVWNSKSEEAYTLRIEEEEKEVTN